jgi:uncharacterized membrane protein YgdD (TMEM256/DUF423 family)
MTRNLVITAAVLGFLGVGLGAFGAHGLQALLDANGRASTFETATQYHMYHALALLAVAWLHTQQPSRWTRWAGIFMIAGVLLFAGSLYILAIFNLGFMGAVAPLGGTSLLIGWVCLGIAAWKTLDKHA